MEMFENKFCKVEITNPVIEGEITNIAITDKLDNSTVYEINTFATFDEFKDKLNDTTQIKDFIQNVETIKKDTEIIVTHRARILESILENVGKSEYIEILDQYDNSRINITPHEFRFIKDDRELIVDNDICDVDFDVEDIAELDIFDEAIDVANILSNRGFITSGIITAIENTKKEKRKEVSLMELSDQIKSTGYDYLLDVDAEYHIALDYNNSLNVFINDNFNDKNPPVDDIMDRIYEKIDGILESYDYSGIEECIEEIETEYGDTYEYEDVEEFIMENREIQGIGELPVIISGYIRNINLKDVYTQQGYELNDILNYEDNPFNKGIAKKLDEEHEYHIYDRSYYYKELDNEPQIYIVEKMTLDEKRTIFEQDEPNIEIDRIFVYLEERDFARGYYVDLERPLIVSKDDISINYDVSTASGYDTPLDLALDDLNDSSSLRPTRDDISITRSLEYTKEELEQVLNMGGIIDYNRGTGSLTVDESPSKNKQQDLDI